MQKTEREQYFSTFVVKDLQWVTNINFDYSKAPVCLDFDASVCFMRGQLKVQSPHVYCKSKQVEKHCLIR
jgi:hypothetical protein